MADIKGVGVDCGMLLVRLFSGLGLVPEFDPRPYTHDWHLHRGEEMYLGWVSSVCDIVEGPPQVGDIILWKIGRCYSHGAVVTGTSPLCIVHALLEYGRVVEEDLSSNVFLSSRTDVKIARAR